MRRFFIVFLSVIAFCSLNIVALAEEFSVYDFEPVVDDFVPVIDDRQPVLVGDTVMYPDDFVSIGISDPDLDGAITDVSVMSLNPITPDDTTGLKSVLLSMFGDYDAVVVEYEYESSNGYHNYLREVQPDYVWLCSCGLFAIVIYCLFRLGGALLRD